MDTNFFERLEALNAKKAELQKEYDAIRSDAKEMAVKLVKQFGFRSCQARSRKASAEVPEPRRRRNLDRSGQKAEVV